MVVVSFAFASFWVDEGKAKLLGSKCFWNNFFVVVDNDIGTQK
jgi:hypothetical protein